jgi:hypothetical protein
MRDEFLIEVYRQMMNDINRHIMVVWQSVGVLVGAFAIFALVEKQVVSADIACSIVLLLCGWLWAHLVDAGYWYNRNLAIISNIERQFLVKDDLKNIHYYFGSHRENNKMITHLRIQLALGLGLSVLVVIYHFTSRVLPGMTPGAIFDPQRAFPYIVAAAVAIYCLKLSRARNSAYKEFIDNSPGVPVSTDGIRYGAGHGHHGKQG